jgi:hypothetical protein
VRYEVCTAVKGFWVVMLCGVAVEYQCFGGPCCLHLQGEMRGQGSCFRCRSREDRDTYEPIGGG